MPPVSNFDKEFDRELTQIRLSRKVGFSLAFNAVTKFITKYKETHENNQPPAYLLFEFQCNIAQKYEGDISDVTSIEFTNLCELAWERIIEKPKIKKVG